MDMVYTLEVVGCLFLVLAHSLHLARLLMS
jgi:hypothetical protein